jgi:DNA-binding CsgD family transcriptional regulator
MSRQLKATGFFWAIVFLLAGFFDVYKMLSLSGATILAVLTDIQTMTLFLMSALFVASAYIRPLVWYQPIIMFVLTPLPFMTTHESFYGLGFFIMGVILLFRLGFYERHRLPKFIVSLAYLYGCELFAALKTSRGLFYTLTPLFFITAFLVFLYLAFQEKLAVYLKEPKPVFSLKGKGLSAAEGIYVRAVATGHSLKEIALECNVSESTVRNSLSRAYKKLEIEDKSAILALAERYEIVE